MKTHPECIPCFLRQSLEVARVVSDDPALHETVLSQVCALVARMDTSQPPPAMAKKIHNLLLGLSGVEDPYREAKSRFNLFILGLLPEFRGMLETSADPFDTALRLAVAGNIIDFGIHASLTEAQVESSIELALAAPLPRPPIDSLRRALLHSRHLLYVGDNAGEVVFDRLFLEQIRRLNPRLEITFATRGGPILNDITREDALQAGIDSLARLVDTGDNTPGCLLSDCSEEFRAALGRADLVLSKGQGNFETLDALRQNAFYLLKVKCEVIAREVGAPEGTLLVLERGERMQVIPQRLDFGGKIDG